jgi:nicotinamide-nucleotide amidase
MCGSVFCWGFEIYGCFFTPKLRLIFIFFRDDGYDFLCRVARFIMIRLGDTERVCMVAEVVSVGTELLLGDIVDSNAALVGKLLAELGIQHLRRQIVGDNLGRLTESLRLALQRSDIVFTIGGLGPTEDDITREGIAVALGDELVHDLEVEKELRSLFAEQSLEWLESQLRQAKRPRCATPVENPNGTAPGLICQKNGKVVIAMPGPPIEFVPMLEGPVRSFLTQFIGKRVIYSRTLRVCGLGEGSVEERIRHLIHSKNPTVAPYAKPGEVHLRITAMAESEEEAERLIAPLEKQIRAILDSHVYGVDQTTLEETVRDLLIAKGETVAVAESCTGGGLGSRITSIPSASSIFLGGVIAYANEVKVKLLNVNPEIIAKHGAVSKECAWEMATGIRKLTGATHGISITGIAGPTGGSKEKPVGLVYVGFAGPREVHVQKCLLSGSREKIRMYSVQKALIGLRAMILGLPLEDDC